MNKKLKALGLSKLEIRIYKKLIRRSDSEAKQLAKQAGIITQGVYRPLKSLTKRNLIAKSGKHPARYTVLPIELGLDESIRSIRSLARSSTRSGKLGVSILPFRFVTSRKNYHRIGEKYFNKVENEVLVIASGTGKLSAEFTKSMYDAIKRSVDYKVIALTYTDINKDKVESWKKNGFQVKHKKGKGINLVIYDREIVQIGLRVKEDEREKVGLIIFNKGLGEFLGEFYDYLWNSAEDV